MRKHGQDPGDGVEVRDETDVVQVIEKLCKYVNKVLKINLWFHGTLQECINLVQDLPGSWNA